MILRPLTHAPETCSRNRRHKFRRQSRRQSTTLEVTHHVTHLVWPHQQDNQAKRLGLSGSIHEEAHLGLLIASNPFLKSLRLVAPTIRWSSIFHLLTTLLEKNTSDSPECTPLYLVLACDLLFPCYSYPV